MAIAAVAYSATATQFVEETQDAFTVESSSSMPIPRRNLAETFDELYDSKPCGNEASPCGVDELNVQQGDKNEVAPHFSLHQDLKGKLSQFSVNRVAFYSIIHDINKEATAMAANDFFIQRVKSMDEEDEVYSPLVVAVKGQPATPRPALSMTDTALIDEERWLLRAMETREPSTICPPTFLQAMGEREYITESRTQLWKPSRSWWEAKSGKNPWIEPQSHNKRWRYLWPLIHYHKFLAKCIKKLKRNGVDVKDSVSPMAVFLRDEVCAVSDHLAELSLYTSEQWMDCLQHFQGWTDSSAEARLRRLITKLSLRPLDEPGDIDSPLLRSQIDEQFLRAMVNAREEMEGIAHRHCEDMDNSTQSSKRHGLPLHPSSRPSFVKSDGKASRNMMQSTSQLPSSHGDTSTASRPSHVPRHWHGWTPQFAVCDENTSVQSALSGDSYLLSGGYQYEYHHHHAMYHHGYYSHPPATPEHSVSENAPYPHYGAMYYPIYDPYNPEHVLAANSGWYDPSVMYASAPPTPSHSNRKKEVPATPGRSPKSSPPDASIQTGLSPYGGPDNVEQTPYKDYSQAPVPMSPFWSHMDYQMHTTLAMTGIVTPHKPPPSSPQRKSLTEEINGEDEKEEPEPVEVIEAQPLIINHSSQYYPYGGGYGRDGFVPPSPATQFMMSPQANHQAAAYYAYNYSTYYPSPRRTGTHRRYRRSPPETPPSAIRKDLKSAVTASTAPEDVSDSEHTAGTAATAAESESICA